MRSLYLILAMLLASACMMDSEQLSSQGQSLAGLRLHMPSDPIFIGSYTHIPVEISSGVNLEDFTFEVPNDAGFVSIAEEKGNPGTSILLAAGRVVGAHTIEVYDKYSQHIGSFPFEVTDRWTDQDVGPSAWIADGESQSPSFETWAAGDPGLQNLDMYPISGEYPLAIVFVETDGNYFDTSDLEKAVEEWTEAAERVVEYMLEVSGGTFEVKPTVFEDPIQLSGTFEEYFDENGWIIGSYFKIATNTALEAGLPLKDFKSVAFVSHSVDASTFAWPMASVGPGRYPIPKDPKKQIEIGGISMPYDWPVVDGRPIHTTLSHELFHNLRLRDMYRPNYRNLGSWDIMDRSVSFSHLSLAHKMMLGWSRKVAPLGRALGPTPFTLHPAADPTPPSGRQGGLEFRLADAVNYYFEYRSRAAATVGDQNLPQPNAVLGTEVFTYYSSQPISAPWIHLLGTAPNGQSPILVSDGQRWYEDQPFSHPPAQISVTLDKMYPGSRAELTAYYDRIPAPDPAITPSSRETRYKSRDILITNARSDAEPKWRDAIHLGAENTIWATVHNYGGGDAKGVKVEFYIKDYTITDAPTFLIGTDTIDIPSGTSRQASVKWIAPNVPIEDVHWCVIAKFEPIDDEITVTNNRAQSNYSRAFSTTASPWTREVRTLTLHNTEKEELIIDLVAEQTNPLYRSYIEHEWVRLDPGESKTVRIMVEYAAEEYMDNGGEPNVLEKYMYVPNDFIVSGIARPRHGECFSYPTGGASLRVEQAKEIDFKTLKVYDAGEHVIEGEIYIKGTGAPAPSGQVLVTLDPGTQKAVTLPPFPTNGSSFLVPTPAGWSEAHVYYIAPQGYADVEAHLMAP